MWDAVVDRRSRAKLGEIMRKLREASPSCFDTFPLRAELDRCVWGVDGFTGHENELFVDGLEWRILNRASFEGRRLGVLGCGRA